jgi:hypothetical protein
VSYIVRTLVSGYVERISSAVFDLYHDEITRLVGKQHGVYALFKKNRLYYVGLARDLRGRVKLHLKDKHAKKWDSFSLYLVRNVEYLKELEALVLHIAEPQGNVQRGKFAGSENLLKRLKGMMEERDRTQRDKILSGSRRKKYRKFKVKKPSSSKPRSPALAGLLSAASELRATYKKQQYVAALDDHGRILLDGKMFNSPSAAGSYIRSGKAIDGWVFWKYRNAQGEWVKIDELRKK